MRDDKDDERGPLTLPRWVKPILSSAVIAVAGGMFQMYTDIAVVKQEIASINRANDRRDMRMDRFAQKLDDTQHDQEKFFDDAIGKLNFIADRHK